MILNCQKEPIQELKQLADSDRHSVLVEGPSGCGKSYLAKQYAAMLGISDFAVINPTVQDIRDSINGSYNLDSPIVLCIENLDCGVPAASYTILKFLEEPLSHVYLQLKPNCQIQPPRPAAPKLLSLISFLSASFFLMI